VIKVSFNGLQKPVSSIEDFGVALDEFDEAGRFELWLSCPGGPSIRMLRSGENAFLMYLRHEGDSGFVSRGDQSCSAAASYALSNGQTIKYPRSACIDVETCYQALAYFFVNEGVRPDWVSWDEA
jgi:hypothetical protein